MTKRELEKRIREKVIPYIGEVVWNSKEMNIGTPEESELFGEVCVHLLAMAYAGAFENDDDVPAERIAFLLDGIIECWSDVLSEVFTNYEYAENDQYTLNIRGIQLQAIVNKAKKALTA